MSKTDNHSTQPLDREEDRQFLWRLALVVVTILTLLPIITRMEHGWELEQQVRRQLHSFSVIPLDQVSSGNLNSGVLVQVQALVGPTAPFNVAIGWPDASILHDHRTTNWQNMSADLIGLRVKSMMSGIYITAWALRGDQEQKWLADVALAPPDSEWELQCVYVPVKWPFDGHQAATLVIVGVLSGPVIAPAPSPAPVPGKMI